MVVLARPTYRNFDADGNEIPPSGGAPADPRLPRALHLPPQRPHFIEVAADAPEALGSTVGVALYRMYDNLADALSAGAPLWSEGASALITSNIADAVRRAPTDGRWIDVNAGP